MRISVSVWIRFHISLICFITLHSPIAPTTTMSRTNAPEFFFSFFSCPFYCIHALCVFDTFAAIFFFSLVVFTLNRILSVPIYEYTNCLQNSTQLQLSTIIIISFCFLFLLFSFTISCEQRDREADAERMKKNRMKNRNTVIRVFDDGIWNDPRRENVEFEAMSTARMTEEKKNVRLTE